MIQAIKEFGVIVIIKDVSCSRIECRETGCSFPDCARRTGEYFDSMEEATDKYPDLEIVYNESTH